MDLIADQVESALSVLAIDCAVGSNLASFGEAEGQYTAIDYFSLVGRLIPVVGALSNQVTTLTAEIESLKISTP